MRNYIGAKIIQAELSTLEEYKKKKYGEKAEINEGDKDIECYIITYPPIGKSQEKPYISMSPVDVFENAYREIHDSEISLIMSNEVSEDTACDKACECK